MWREEHRAEGFDLGLGGGLGQGWKRKHEMGSQSSGPGRMPRARLEPQVRHVWEGG